MFTLITEWIVIVKIRDLNQSAERYLIPKHRGTNGVDFTHRRVVNSI